MKPAATTALARCRSWYSLLIGLILLLFANAASTIPIASWLAALFLLRFVRVERPRRGRLTAYVVLGVGFAFQFRGMTPIPLELPRLEYLGYYTIYVLVCGIPLIPPTS